MKVTGHNLSDLLPSKTPASSTPKPQAEAAQTATAAASSPGVAVVITRSNRGTGTAMASAPDVDTKKVAAMKAAIANGSFVVNPEAIADKLLSNAQEMLPATAR